MAGEWKLTIEFRDMFFLVNYLNKRGAVVLLPHEKHSAVLWIDDPKYSYGLYRAQVNIRDANKNILWGSECTKPTSGFLLSANHLFGPNFTVRPDLIEAPAVPKDLNARIVLGGGKFRDLPARDRHARFAWSFTNSASGAHPLTDRLRYQVTMPSGVATIIIKHEDGVVDEIPLPGRDHELVIWNRDLRDVDDDEANIRIGVHELKEYAHLHALIGKDPNDPSKNVHPIGDYPSGISTKGSGPIGNDEPICGGEEGEPDPPPPDPANP